MSQQENNQQNSNGNDWPSSSQGDEWISSAQQPQSNNDGGFLTSTPNEPYSQQSNSTFRCYEEHWSQFNSQEDSFWGRSSQESNFYYFFYNIKIFRYFLFTKNIKIN